MTENRTDFTESEASSPHEPDLAREGFVISVAICGPLFIIFVVAIYVYAHFGEPFVDGLDEQIGGLLAEQADSLVQSGQIPQAIEKYREAISLKFDNSERRLWALHKFADLLMKEQFYDEAADVARQAIELSEENGRAFSQYFWALRQAGRHEESLDATEIWFEWAEKRAEPATMARVKYFTGYAYFDLQQKENAISAFLSGYSIYPEDNNALSAANVLHQLGRGSEALPLLDFVIDKGEKHNAQKAEELRTKILGSM